MTVTAISLAVLLLGHGGVFLGFSACQHLLQLHKGLLQFGCEYDGLREAGVDG